MSRASEVWLLVRDVFSAVYVLKTRPTNAAQRYYINRMITGHIEQLREIEKETGKDPVEIIEASFGNMVQMLDKFIEDNS